MKTEQDVHEGTTMNLLNLKVNIFDQNGPFYADG